MIPCIIRMTEWGGLSGNVSKTKVGRRGCEGPVSHPLHPLWKGESVKKGKRGK
jgi:hypothetical protein